jgi:hypothetical protein
VEDSLQKWPVVCGSGWETTPALALEKALLNFDVCVSRGTLAALVAVLSWPKFDRYAPPRQRDDFAAGFRARAVVSEVTTTVSDCVPMEGTLLSSPRGEVAMLEDASVAEDWIKPAEDKGWGQLR